MQLSTRSTDRICNWKSGHKKTAIALLFAALANISCGEKPQPPAEESTQTKLFQAQREALEKAKAVELAAKKQAEEMQQQMEQQTK